MENKFAISELYRELFNREIPQSFNIPNAEQVKREANKGSAFFADDIYGREIFHPVKFFIPIGSGELELQPQLAVITINQKKTIVETPLVERSGTVKELISTEDYNINIKGLIVRPDDKWPEEEIEAIAQLYTYNQAVRIRSPLTDIFLNGDFNHQVVIKSFNMPGSAGTTHAKAFELETVSDSIFELRIK